MEIKKILWVTSYPEWIKHHILYLKDEYDIEVCVVTSEFQALKALINQRIDAIVMSPYFIAGDIDSLSVDKFRSAVQVPVDFARFVRNTYPNMPIVFYNCWMDIREVNQKEELQKLGCKAISDAPAPSEIMAALNSLIELPIESQV